MLYHTGPNSLVFFAECYIVRDSDLRIRNYKNEVQLKLKLHQLTSRRLKGHLRLILACFTLPTLPGFYISSIPGYLGLQRMPPPLLLKGYCF